MGHERSLGVPCSITASARASNGCGHQSRGIHVGLKTEVAMDVLGKLASAAEEMWRRVEGKLRARGRTTLTGKPFSEVREETLPPRGHRVTLLDRLDSVGDIEPQELAEIRAD